MSMSMRKHRPAGLTSLCFSSEKPSEGMESVRVRLVTRVQGSATPAPSMSMAATPSGGGVTVMGVGQFTWFP